MQQLSGMDTMFVHQETARTPMHITAVMIYDPSSAPEQPVRFKNILKTFENNLHKSGLFRRKLALVPWSLDNPYWLEDANFDLEYHVRHVALPKPADWRQFCILMARLHARGLDMKRPLWEAYVIEGLGGMEELPDGAFAILLKIHHAAIDGISGAQTISAIHTDEPVLAQPPAHDPWTPDDAPNGSKLAAQGYVRNLTKPAKLIGQMSDLLSQVRDRDPADTNSRVDSRRRTRFNRRVSAHRMCDSVRLNLEAVKKVKNGIEGVTINDVVVATVGGAMRSYLSEKGELPQDSLGAAAPINVRKAGESSSGGNQISAMTLTLRTDIEDPLERLKAVSEHAKTARATSSALGDNTFNSIADNFSAWLGPLSAGAVSAATWLQDLPLSAHTVVSNVPGPQQPLYMSGAELKTIIGLGPLLDNMGLFHAVMSVAGELTITFVACREMMPDPAHYRSCLEQSFADLEKATTKPKKKPRARRQKKSSSS